MVRRTPAVRLHALQLLNARADLPDRPRLENSSRPQDPPCIGLGATGAELVKKCVSELSGNAQFFGCFLFEDSAGRAEDARTGLSCPARQAALAKQCRARCSDFAAKFPTCRDPNIVWQESFGDIGGLAFGSARVELCGPRLASGYRPFPSYREHGWK
jgi:hypothetical protein